MLECFHKFEKGLAIRRKGVSHLATTVVFVEKASLHQRFCVLGDGLEVSPKLVGDTFNRYAIVLRNSKYDSNTPMISRPLKIPL